MTFTLSSGSPSFPNAINITLPYTAFDLTLKQPNSLGDTSSIYFPLRRAVNDSQYVLGRTFLQEAYIISDFDRGIFSVFPALFPDNSVKENIVTILPPSETSEKSGTSPLTGASPHTGHLLTTTIVLAIIIPAVFLASFTVLTIVYRRRRAKRRNEAKDPKAKKNQPGELDGGEESERRMIETDGREVVAVTEMGAERERYEMPGGTGDDGAAELGSGDVERRERAELEGF